MPNSREQSEELSLSKAAQYLLEECRMVLPGIQALFGFQLVVVFSPGFSEKLTRPEQLVHFTAIRVIARKWTNCSGLVSFSEKPGLNTTTSWKPNSAWMPGKTMRHSSSKYCAALESESSSLCSRLFGIQILMPILLRN